MVIGGQSDAPGSIIDNTEVYDSDIGSWAISGAKLPQPMRGLRAANINDRVFIFGDYTFFLMHQISQVHNNFRWL